MQKHTFRILLVATLAALLLWTASLAGATTPDSSFEFDGTTGTITRFVGDETVVDIPSSIDGVPVLAIGDEAFQECSWITSVKVPSRVHTVGEYAFKGCTSLTSIELPFGITSISEAMFYGCSSLAAITIPSSVKAIGNHAFASCLSLTEVTINRGITSIGWAAFANCVRLAKIVIPLGVESIGQSAFAYCTSLNSVTIPSTLVFIGESSFSGCARLVSITIPSSVISVDKYAFESCEDLSSACFKGNAPTYFGDDVFYGAPTSFQIYYPKGARGWSTPTWNGYQAKPYDPNSTYLSSLSVKGLVSPIRFSRTKQAYALSLKPTIKSTKVVAARANPLAQIWASTSATGGYKKASTYTLSLARGKSKTIYFKVVVPNRVKRIYAVKITRR